VPGDATIVAGRRVADRYRLTEPRHNGVWDAVDEILRRNVVVHLLRADADAEAKEHFTAEARTLARLNHRNIVATYDTGVDGDGTSYRVEALAGGTELDLDDVEARHRLSYALQIAQAIADGHAIGLVHGSLTSASALVDEEGRLQVRGLRLPRPDEDLEAAKHRDVAALVQVVTGLAPAKASPLRDLAVAWRSKPPESTAAMLNQLDAVPDDSDINVPPPLPTPAAGVPAVRRRGRQGVIAVVGALVFAAVAAAVVLPAQRGDDGFNGQMRPLGLTAKSFDPQGKDRVENEALARLAVDNNPSTEWKTERYKRAHFGNLKDGLGLILQLQAGSADLAQLTLTSATKGWQVELYVADQPAASLAGWGRPVASTTVRGDETTLLLNGARGAAILLWISDTGTNRQVHIEEVVVQGRA
jgi:tRNA A-37 threonylcarbamoyl transferase component Bud32